MDDGRSLPRWSFQDAWLLTAIGQYHRRGCSLSALIGAADALNHDIPTETQTAASLGRLAASGLIKVDSGHYRTTGRGRAIYKQRRGGMFELSGSVLDALAAVSCVEGTINLAPGEFASAYECYRRR